MTCFRTAKALTLSLVGALCTASTGLAAPPGSLPFGVYDPNGAFADDPDVSIEHLFLPWEDVLLQSLYDADAYAAQRNRSVLATIEPWTWTRDERNSPRVLIEGIQAGDYDENMSTICAIFDDFQSPVTIRWAHEMEDRSGQFIWAGWNPDTYIAAFQRMVDVCRREAPDVDFMWSPLGLDGFEAYYPGDEYVDVVGLSVFGLQAWEEAILGGERSFREVLEPRYNRAVTFGRPVVVAELGFVGDPSYVRAWIDDMRQDIAGLSELVAVIYFNQTEVYPWPDGYGRPDWRFDFNVLN